ERARGLKLLLELVERRRRARVDVRVVAHDLMAALAEALRHPGAHPAEADHSQFHLDPYSDDLAAEAAERLEVALGLRTDQPPEAEVPTRDRDLRARVVHDLDEEPRRRSALLQLPGRVQVARPEPVRHDTVRLVCEVDERLQLTLSHRIDERLDRNVVRRLRSSEQVVE